jgi:hypothetical protein
MQPATGRFWTMDPFEGSSSDPESLHKYLYANANPVNFPDPTGKISAADQVATAAAITILASAAIFTFFAVKSKLYLLANAFQKPPDALILCYQAAYPIGRFDCLSGTTLQRRGNKLVRLASSGEVLMIYKGPWYLW